MPYGNIELRPLPGPDAKSANKFLSVNPGAKEHFDHFTATGVLADTFRTAARERINELSNETNQIHERIRMTQKKAARSINGPDGKPAFDTADLKAAEQELEDNKKMIEAAKRERDSQPASQAPSLRDWMAANVNRKLISRDIGDFGSEEKIATLTEAVQAEQKELRTIENANKTDEEVTAIIRAQFDAMKRSPLSYIDFSSVLAGGSIDREGNFSMVNIPKIHFPLEQYFSESQLTAEGNAVSGVITTLIPDPFAMLVGLDHDDSFFNRVVAAALAQNKGQRQIAMADKPRLIAEQKTKLRIAERRLEFGYRRVEASGKRIGRPREWSPMVMLWLENQTASVADRAMFG